MIERLAVIPGPGTVIRYGQLVAWIAPGASASLVTFLAESARNLADAPAGGDLVAGHLAGVLRQRDPEPGVAFAVVGPGRQAWTGLLHGPAQAWDGQRWVWPEERVGWVSASFSPGPVLAVGERGSVAAGSPPDRRWDLEAGVVPGAGFVLVAGPAPRPAAAVAGADPTPRPGPPEPYEAPTPPEPPAPVEAPTPPEPPAPAPGQDRVDGPAPTLAMVTPDPPEPTLALATPTGPEPQDGPTDPGAATPAEPATSATPTEPVTAAEPAGPTEPAGSAEPAGPTEPSPAGPAEPSPATPAGLDSGSGGPRGLRLVDLRPRPGLDTVPPRPPLPAPGIPPLRPAGAAVVAGIMCPRDHLNRPGASRCARCGVVIGAEGALRVTGARPALGCLVTDAGRLYRLDGGYLVGTDPGSDPTVRDGLARSLTLPGDDVAPSHAEIRLHDWDVIVTDRASEGGTHIYPPGAAQWERIGPFDPTVLEPGTHIAFGQRIVTFLTPHAGGG